MRHARVVLYDIYEFQRGWLAGLGAAAEWSADVLQSPGHPFAKFGGPALGSALEVFAHAAETRGKPDFGLDSTIVDGREVPVVEDIVVRKPFGQLKRFVRDGVTG